ncbi:MAG: hypothetical protein KUF80_00035 [Candidatus Thiodiazotropha sp. (ex Codakia orbicularis)]|nr:hypothetical protein [Candidatus Thiodiazotropha sp. (ex Codakia orbicularis)]
MNESQESMHRVSPGGFSITLFIGCTIYFGLVNHGWQTLLTFKAAIFILLGILFSVLLIGVPFHLLRVWLEKRVFKTAETSLSPTGAKQLKTSATLLMVVQVVLTFYLTKFAYLWYFS